MIPRLAARVAILAVLLAGLQAQAQTPAQNICADLASSALPVPAPTPAPKPVIPGAGGVGGTGVMAGRPGLGGTGVDPGGIGGTGQVAGRRGLGGTGIDPGGIGGTGIVGVITGFASICVNGLEVHFDDTTPVSDAGEPVPARQLALGQLVAVQARGQGAELTATRIALLHTAVGPIAAMDALAGQLQLLGQTVTVRDYRDLEGLQPGDWVRVSGMRLAQGAIAASRLDAIAPQPQAQLNGVVQEVQGDMLRIGTAQVRLGAGLRSATIVPGMEITVAGQWDGRVLQAQRVLREPTRQGIAGAGRVVLEGYVHAAGARQLDLGLGTLVIGPDAQLPGGGLAGLAVDQRVLVRGDLAPDGQITLDRVELRSGGGEGGRGAAGESDRNARGRAGQGRGQAAPAGERARDSERDRQRDLSSGGRLGGGESGRGGRSGGDDGGSRDGGSGSNSGSGGALESGSGSNSGSGSSGGGGSGGSSGGGSNSGSGSSGGSGGGGRDR